MWHQRLPLLFWSEPVASVTLQDMVLYPSIHVGPVECLTCTPETPFNTNMAVVDLPNHVTPQLGWNDDSVCYPWTVSNPSCSVISALCLKYGCTSGGTLSRLPGQPSLIVALNSCMLVLSALATLISCSPSVHHHWWRGPLSCPPQSHPIVR